MTAQVCGIDRKKRTEREVGHNPMAAAEKEEMADPFRWTVHFHALFNLPACIPHLRDGVLYGTDGRPLEEGEDENPYIRTGGAFIIYDSKNIREVILKTALLPDSVSGPIKIATLDDYVAYLAGKKADKTIFWDREAQQITEIYSGGLKNHYPELNLNLAGLVEKNLPQNFSSAATNRIGGKTLTALQIPLVCYLEGYGGVGVVLIKGTVHNNDHQKKTGPGLPKVVHIKYLGPEAGYFLEEFYARIDPGAKDHQYLEPKHKIIGVHATYERNGSGIVLSTERITPVAEKDGRRVVDIESMR